MDNEIALGVIRNEEEASRAEMALAFRERLQEKRKEDGEVIVRALALLEVSGQGTREDPLVIDREKVLYTEHIAPEWHEHSARILALKRRGISVNGPLMWDIVNGLESVDGREEGEL